MTAHAHPSGAHDAFIEHVAETLIQIGELVHPGDPVAATEFALAGAGWQPGEYAIRERQLPDRPMATDDLDPETGEEWGVGPDIDPEEELAFEGQQEIEDQEAGQ